MRAAFAAGLLALVACARPPVTAPLPAARGPSSPSSAEPSLGRFALSMRWHQYSSCSQSWDDTSVRTSFVLELGGGGVATACRGKRMDSAGPGYSQAMEEQQGFRGRWVREGEELDVWLELDAEACPQRRGYTNREPQRWHLSCRELPPRAGWPLPGKVLGCRFVDRAYTEELGYTVSLPGLEGEWMLLGAGDGLRVEYDGDEFSYEPKLEVTWSPRPVLADEWTRPFAAKRP